MAFASGARHSGLGRQPVWLLLLLLLFSGAMVTRLAWLQLLHGAENRQRADENRIRLMPRNPIRGRLLDRHGRVLATSRLTYNLYVQPREVSDEAWPALRDRLAALLELPANQLEEQRRSGANSEGFRVQLAENLKPDQVLRFRERSSELSGAEVDVDVLRSYPHGRLGAHVLGYTSGITEEEYQRLRDQGYRIRDRVGRSGLEKVFEAHLRGEWGGQQVEVNAAGQVQRVLGEKPARAGKDLRLTLDLPLQQAAEKALDGVAKGAIVAMDPNTGAIRAMASRPSFDPNIFSPAPSIPQWAALNSPEAPLLNRTLQGFPPASTFKIVTSLAALESERYHPGSTELTTASYCRAGLCYRDHVSMGQLGFPMALALSSNSFFYRAGINIGGDALFHTARQLGFGQRTGVELRDEESKGLLGDKAWKKEVLGEPWTDVDTITASIGQGAVLVTPLQMARMYAAVANGGWLVTPHLVEREPQRQWIGFQPDTIATVRKGLRLAVEQGTARALNQSNLPPAAGKTGTAEDPPRPVHAWFGGYAPAEDADLVVVAFGENTGGFGGTVAVPMAQALLTAWFANVRVAAPVQPVPAPLN
ncbi:penicillin-binding protein 2 [Cyanobium sp. ATX 6A2]|jgi:penicillin-binding protein 2|uniref:penicillin-binding protein 2 n=1 Tax=Cyanobium sp. ATX 6A2 TaxID=2823700 RepID=UPI0020CCC838|nr:penicillin-binding protein 2 [Cyanobium sp. ATX 6A2]MCP9886952.1 penicillin-binding protein 2 [Cyanobium sp. ATX 6A2]